MVCNLESIRMKHNVPVNNSIIIPEHELEITASRSGGAGGQHVNKTSSRITVRWNVKNTQALSPEQKERVLQKLQSQLTVDGDIIIHSSESRSQQHNKDAALARLAHIIAKALYVPKKRRPTTISKTAQEKRLHAKSKHSFLKKMRSKKIQDY